MWVVSAYLRMCIAKLHWYSDWLIAILHEANSYVSFTVNDLLWQSGKAIDLQVVKLIAEEWRWPWWSVDVALSRSDTSYDLELFRTISIGYFVWHNQRAHLAMPRDVWSVKQSNQRGETSHSNACYRLLNEPVEFRKLHHLVASRSWYHFRWTTNEFHQELWSFWIWIFKCVTISPSLPGPRETWGIMESLWS